MLASWTKGEGQLDPMAPFVLGQWGRALCFRKFYPAALGLCPFPQEEMSVKPRGRICSGHLELLNPMAS